MAGGAASYGAATRHPWSCFLFVLPLLTVYEAGVFLVGTGQSDSVRNGADVWLRWVLGTLGLPHLYWAPALLLLLLGGWCVWRRQDRPGELVSLWIGMAVESVIFALGLWAVCHGVAPMLKGLGVQLNASPSQPDPAMRQVITFVGAGVYEETLFRLILFSALTRLLEMLEFPRLGAFGLASLVSALLFASAHHIGPHGENFDPYIFTFRTLAGLYFALLFHWRGFGIAVGAHAGYDVLVGILVEL